MTRPPILAEGEKTLRFQSAIWNMSGRGQRKHGMRFLLNVTAIYRHPLNREKRREYRRRRLTARLPTLPHAIIEQITQQARHDLAILAPGALALPHLRQVDAVDLFARDGVDVVRLLGSLRVRPKTVIVAPWLVVGGAEYYAADLLEALLSAGAGPALVVLTEHTASEAGDWQKLARLAPFRAAQLLFWRDFCGPGGVRNAGILGRFLHLFRSERVIVVNSRIGFDAIAVFGRALSQSARLYCAYFSIGVNALGAPYGARFPRRTAQFALTLTDNESMAATMRRLHGSQPGPGVAVLPSRVPEAPEDVFASRIAARRTRVRSARKAFRWVWISRIEKMKGTDILTPLAGLRPNHQFDLFGPLRGNLRDFGLVGKNVEYRGFLPDVLTADFSSYDGFVFTSLFEGMPNVVLEMSQQAIPMILTDVGGLRETFSDSVLFVPPRSDPGETAALFAAALDRVAAMDDTAITAMVSAAREKALARHSPAAYARAVAELFGL
jgi:glycosyltransferase involved in cell wall biosynthesis